MSKEFFNELADETAKSKCVNCGKEVADLEKGCPKCKGNNSQKTLINIEYKNTIASILKVIGWIIIVIGFIVGIVLGNTIYEYGRYEFNFVAMLITWFASSISALLFFGLAEVIAILHDIRAKIKK